VRASCACEGRTTRFSVLAGRQGRCETLLRNGRGPPGLEEDRGPEHSPRALSEPYKEKAIRHHLPFYHGHRIWREPRPVCCRKVYKKLLP